MLDTSAGCCCARSCSVLAGTLTCERAQGTHTCAQSLYAHTHSHTLGRTRPIYFIDSICASARASRINTTVKNTQAILFTALCGARARIMGCTIIIMRALCVCVCASNVCALLCPMPSLISSILRLRRAAFMRDHPIDSSHVCECNNAAAVCVK